jgi:hypothetical protein
MLLANLIVILFSKFQYSRKKEKFNISFSVYEFRFLAVVMAMEK